ncbi:hypothetical protein C8R46DRAFT_1106583 [Mycena filopes]|nr:hypothetical protein C8R46DRAFT_1106583 [Mycena filopes]
MTPGVYIGSAVPLPLLCFGVNGEPSRCCFGVPAVHRPACVPQKQSRGRRIRIPMLLTIPPAYLIGHSREITWWMGGCVEGDDAPGSVHEY